MLTSSDAAQSSSDAGTTDSGISGNPGLYADGQRHSERTAVIKPTTVRVARLRVEYQTDPWIDNASACWSTSTT